MATKNVTFFNLNTYNSHNQLKFNVMYTSENIKIVGNSYQTKDGKYKTKTSDSSWYYDSKNHKKVEFNKGYAYWYDESDSRMGSTSYDYLFFNGKEGINSAVKVLNEVISL